MAKPIEAFSYKGIEVAVWENEKGVTFSVRKRYLDKSTGEWKDGKFLFVEEVSLLIVLLQRALAEYGVKSKQEKPKETIEQDNFEDFNDQF